ncbi:hypothetical protein NW762_011627 [Fusarium torreyae]|uniref:AB hydrolase-1 domain-containing protein n=1 Tax=Fusarium torreyae TaxID=1237075 RepID=A0A9W8V939_9HYPO|nr:hypothetical protein NW762_011627 [Fusarium torreyae]
MSFKIQIPSRKIAVSKDLQIHYREAQPIGESKGTVLLIHGYPQTSFQFRFVIQPIAAAGYRVIAPDTTGHGSSSKPVRDVSGFTKKQLAQDLYTFLKDGLGIKSPIHVIGHDIGGMIAFAFAMQFPEYVASIIWGECPLPGTSEYQKFKHSREHWHFTFQGGQPDMAAWLVQGKERPYIKQFYDRFANNLNPFTDKVVDHYVAHYETPGALQSAFYVYAAFELDASQNEEWLKMRGKVQVRNLILTGADHALAAGAESMANQVFEKPHVRFVADSGHYIAEENPQDFVKHVLEFLGGK